MTGRDRAAPGDSDADVHLKVRAAHQALRDPAPEPVDPDVDLHVAAQRTELRDHVATLAVIAAGGILGALARHQLQVWWPTAPGEFDWTIWTVNVTGCLVLGAFMVLVTEVWSNHALLRPFIATGVLGGYTTFSAYAGSIRLLFLDGHAPTAAAYLGATVAGAVLATSVATVATRHLVNRLRTT